MTRFARVLKHIVVCSAAALLLVGAVSTASAEDATVDDATLFPAPMTQAVAAKRQQFFEATQPKLTPQLL
ncbi:MAG: hypothetical protein ACOVO5_08235, partial [Devosia sp.]